MTKYKPLESEKRIQSFWKENDFFKNENSKGKKTFTILLPPPNITGQLHLGHAWDSYYPDTLIRYKQLNGYQAIWYPGMDHAGIATQSKVEQKIFKETGKNRFDLGREKFIKQIWDWKKHYEKNIYNQWDKLGIALDYKKIKFTLDDDVNKLVTKTFIDFFNKGLIYKEKKIINWDPKLKTAISNVEVLHEDRQEKLYNIKYQLENSKEFLVISTTRPETMFGDTAIFVNPNDKRYKKLIGKNLVNPVNGKLLKIYADEYVDIEFGTGVMKATPAHDFNDYDLYKKYKLDIINVFNKDATLNEEAGEYSGLDRYDARKKIIESLKKKDMIDSIIDHNMSISISERSGSVIEPMISTQWFLKSSELAKKAKTQQKNLKSSVLFYPKRFETTFINWLENMEDWCISRQLWWGHKIPAWYKDNEIKVQDKSPGKDWVQDDDVLDTWFSSALWPVVFKDEKVSSKSDNPNYLTDILFTGYDIILFWVSRMIFQSYEIERKLPFKKAIIHGLIRDSKGKKMSKSLNNGIDPMEVIEKWGSDSLRIFLLGNSTPGQDIKFNETKVRSAWDLNNKLFNIKNLLEKLSKDTNVKRLPLSKMDFSKIDNYILSKIDAFKNILKDNIEEYNLPIIFSNLNKLVFEDFANTYLEFLKTNNDEKSIERAINIFIELLIIIHPLIPFTTEDIYQSFGKDFKLKKSILLEEYNDLKFKVDFDIDILLSSIKVARTINSNPKYNKDEKIYIYVDNKKKFDINFVNKYISYLNAEIINEFEEQYSQINIFPKIGILYSKSESLNLLGIDKLKSQIKSDLEFELKRANTLLGNKKFVSNASSELVTSEKEKKKFYSESLDMIK